MNNNQTVRTGENVQEKLLTLLPYDSRKEYSETISDALCMLLIAYDGDTPPPALKNTLLNMAYMRMTLMDAVAIIEKDLPHAP